MRCRGLARPVRRYPADCPGELIRWGNQRTTLRTSYHRSRTPAESPVARSPCRLGTNSLVLQGLPPKVREALLLARSSLRVVPVFAGREVVQPRARAAQEGSTTIFMIL